MATLKNSVIDDKRKDNLQIDLLHITLKGTCLALCLVHSGAGKQACDINFEQLNKTYLCVFFVLVLAIS